jgi:acetylornithine deacetylase/succinyl-diaminopimelate desuccinylase-like protein
MRAGSDTLAGHDASSIASHVDADRLVAMAVDAVSVPSPTGSEEAMGIVMRDALSDLGLQVVWQEVEDGRPNVIGTLRGVGDGRSFMLNGHLDTSVSGKEPWLAGIPGLQPKGFVRDGRIYGLGISNMKGALCCYVEALRALSDAGVRLLGDVVIACVAGEIEKTPWGEHQGGEYRGYGAGATYLAAHGGIADCCLLGEPTQNQIVVGHYGALWVRISTHGPFVHTAFSEGRMPENSIVRMQEVVAAVREWLPAWEKRTAYRGEPGIANLGCINGGFPWRASRTPQRTDLFVDLRVPPTLPMPEAAGEVRRFVRELADRFPDYGIEHEIYLTQPGSEISDDDPLLAAIEQSHHDVFGEIPSRGSVRWFSDASALSRHGVPSVNYGTSSGLPDVKLGENLEIDGLVRTAQVYALTAMRMCGVAE